MPGTIIINGGGISGLVCALVLAERGAGPRVCVVERNREPGGLLRRFHYGEWGDFDYGMHNMLQTGIEPLDELLFGLLDEEEWQVLDGPKRDVAGVYVNGTLQTHTPYIDLRSLPRRDYEAALAGLFDHFSEAQAATMQPDESSQTAYDYAVGRFGRVAAEKTVVPAVEKIHRKAASDLDYMATTLTPMSRLAFCDTPLVAELTKSAFLRDRIAWSDQRTLPLERTSGRRGFYPVKYGIYRVVNAIVQRLQSAGVRLLTDAEITGVETAAGRVSSVQIRAGGITHRVDQLECLVWSGQMAALARHLGVAIDAPPADPPLTTAIANLVVDRCPEAMRDLYYFFCYDPAFATFRLTNFINYSRGAARNGGYPVCLELLLDADRARAGGLEQLAIDEYRRLGVTSDATNVLFARAECLDGGFPMPSVNNIRRQRAARAGIRAKNLANVHLVGILAEEHLFFQTDVLADAYRKLQ